MRKLSSSQTEHILFLLDSGMSATAIQRQTHVSLGAISKIRSDHRPTLSKSSGGRPPLLTSSSINYAKRMIHTGKAENAVQAAGLVQGWSSTSFSTQTLRRGLKRSGMVPVVKKKRPLLKPHHRKARLEFAERHQEWTVEDWKRVIWSDETKINRLGSDGRKYVWKEEGEGLSDRLVEGTVKFGGGNLMMWGCMTWDGIGFATRIEGKMDAELYVQILDDEFQNTLDYYGLEKEDVIFQQDNDPKHTSKKAKSWFQDNGYDVLRWPAQSPDLNPIEHLWHYLKTQINAYPEPARSLNELWERAQEEWEKIPKEECQKLIESMPRRLAAVVRAKGGYTKY